jgi:hypothetical protein
VPVRDEVIQCLVLPAMFRSATRRHVVTIFGANACGKWDAGAIPAASILRATNLSSAIIYVSERRGLVSRGLLSATVRTAALAFRNPPGVTHETAERLTRLFAVESCDDGVAPDAARELLPQRKRYSSSYPEEKESRHALCRGNGIPA